MNGSDFNLREEVRERVKETGRERERGRHSNRCECVTVGQFKISSCDA